MTQQSIGQTLEVIRNQHKALLLQIEEPGEVDLEQVRVLLKTLVQAGTTIENAEDRSLLHELIRYWSSFINDKTGEFPAAQLQPFDASLIHSRSTYRPKFFRQRAVESPEQPMEGQNRQSFLENRKATEPPSSLISDQNRQRMLARVRSLWITGVLEHSLHGAALIALELREQSRLTENPWRLVLQEMNQPARPLPSGTRITQVYDNADGELLILGEPGSGKTTLLLELARDLLERARRDDRHPIPIVLNLSSWATRQPPLTDWIIEELNTKYQVPHSLGRLWVDTDQLLLLLDGLDEVSPVYRLGCVEAINIYRQRHGLLPTVVCSRSAEYLALSNPLLLQSAIVVQPLTAQQVDDYLSSAGEALEALRLALHNDAILQELVTSPLMLNVLTLAYYGTPAADLLTVVSREERRRQIFAGYVQRMLQRRGSKTRYTPQQTMRWLAWLARQLAQHNQVEFYLERMQPDWLSGSRQNRLYYRAIVRLVIGLLSGLFICLSLGIALGLFIGTALGFASGLVSGITGGFASGIAGGIIIGLASRVEAEIQPVETFVWSWRRLVRIKALSRRLIGGISASSAISLITYLILINNFSIKNYLLLLEMTLLLAFIVVIVITSISGVSSKRLDRFNSTVPNQGMSRSARNSIRIGIIGGFAGGIISMVAFLPILSPLHLTITTSFVSLLCFLLLSGTLGGTICGLVVGLSNGGIVYIQHIALRFLLWRSGFIPWSYSSFLDYAAERILLSKVGGGYIFVHRLLLEYFVSLETNEISVDGIEQAQISSPSQ